MKYCSRCGAKLTRKVPVGDDRPRFACDACGTVHYENPKMVVGCIAEWDDSVFMCRRAIHPRRGRWTLPAGYLENGETVLEAAKREAFEEGRVRLENLTPYALFNLTFVKEVYFIFRANLADTNFEPGEESLEVKLIAEHEIPWESIAFSVVREALERYFHDRAKGQFLFHMGDISR